MRIYAYESDVCDQFYHTCMASLTLQLILPYTHESGIRRLLLLQQVSLPCKGETFLRFALAVKAGLAGMN